MDQFPLVSILINNYNYGQFLGEAIDSALSQNYPNIEVIVVDDGSVDESQAVIEQYGNRIKAIFKPNGGQASAFNVGFDVSQGEIICFLDSDDMFHSEKVAEVVNILKAQKELDWFFHSMLLFKQNSEIDSNTELQKKFAADYDLRFAMRRGKLKGILPKELSIATSGMCFKRNLLGKILPMPEEIRITSDDYIKYIALGISKGFASLNELAFQRIHGSNAYTLRSNKLKLRVKIELLTAYWIKNNFPELSQFSNNLFAANLSILWRNAKDDLDCRDLLMNYLVKTNVLEKLEIYARSLYYLVKR